MPKPWSWSKEEELTAWSFSWQMSGEHASVADFKDYARQVHILNRQNLHHSATKILLLTVLAVCLTFQRLQTHCNTLTHTFTHTQCCSINSRRRCTICTIPRFYLRTFLLVYVYTCVCLYTCTSMCQADDLCTYTYTNICVKQTTPSPPPLPRTWKQIYICMCVFIYMCSCTFAFEWICSNLAYRGLTHHW